MKVERMISIIMLLLERKIVSAPELAGIFEVSTRTIYRDIDAINQAGIPIVTYPGLNGGVGIMDTYKVDKRLFTASDITSLLIGLGGIHSVLTGDGTRNALVKIKGMIPQEQLKEIETQTSQISIDLSPWKQDSRQDNYLALIKKAIEERAILTIGYSNADGSTTIRNVEPYRLLLKKNNWYLQGYCRLRNEMRTFRLFRIESIEPTGKNFEPRPIDWVKLDGSFLADIPTVAVTIRFHETIKKDVIGLWGDGSITSFTDGYYTANILITDNEGGYKSLFLMGDKCECIAPKRIRNYIAKTATRIAKMHSAK